MLRHTVQAYLGQSTGLSSLVVIPKDTSIFSSLWRMYKWDSSVLSAGREAAKIRATEQKENPSRALIHKHLAIPPNYTPYMHTQVVYRQRKAKQTWGYISFFGTPTKPSSFFLVGTGKKQSQETHPGSQVARRGLFALSHWSSEGRGCPPQISTPAGSTWSTGRDAQLCPTHGWVGGVQLLPTF